MQKFNRTTSVRTVASSTAPNDYFNEICNSVVNLAYVTGSHNLKVGVNQEWGWSTLKVEPHGDMSVLTFVNNAAGVPTANSRRTAQHAVHRAKTYSRPTSGFTRRTSGR